MVINSLVKNNLSLCRKKQWHKNTVKTETIISGITNPSKEGFARGFDVSTKTMNDFIKTTGIEKPILSVDAFTKTTAEAEEIVEKYEDDKDWANYSITNANAFRYI